MGWIGSLCGAIVWELFCGANKEYDHIPPKMLELTSFKNEVVERETSYLYYVFLHISICFMNYIPRQILFWPILQKVGIGSNTSPLVGPNACFFFTEHLLYWSILHSLVTYNSIILEQNVDEYWSICYFNQPPKTLPEAQRTQDIDYITWVNLSARIVQNRFQWHYLNWLQIWSPDGATCISSKFGHQMAPLA